MLNRKERRKIAKDKVTPEQLKTLQNKTKETSVRFTVDAYTVAVAIVLHDKFGFGEVRLRRVLAYIVDTFDSIQNNYVKIEELRKVILDECNIDIKMSHCSQS